MSEPLTPDSVQEVDFYGDTISGALVRVDNSERIYVPLRPICAYLGLDWSAQTRRLRRDDVLAEAAQGVAMMATPGGTQEMLCLPLDLLPGWLFGVDTSRVKPELREKLKRYRRECFRALWDAFRPVIQPAAPEATTLTGAALAYQLAEAVANLAREQMELEARMTQAAQWAGGVERRLTALELRLSDDQTIDESQAAELAGAVKNVAAVLPATGQASPYQRVYAELYRRFGISTYRALPRRRYDEALTWLRQWYGEVSHDTR